MKKDEHFVLLLAQTWGVKSVSFKKEKVINQCINIQEGWLAQLVRAWC